jgi:type IV pilus assembly protein PilX
MIRRFHTRSFPRTQRGAVLIIALILLAIMTLLAVTAMNMNTMEERMASNVQQINRAFQAAQSGLSVLIVTPNTLSTTLPFSGTQSFGSYGATVNFTATFVQQTPPSRGSGWDISKFAFYYFNLAASSWIGGTAASPYASSNVAEGIYQVAPKS